MITNLATSHPCLPAPRRHQGHATATMPVTSCDELPANDEVVAELAEHGLRRYVLQIAAALDVGPEAVWSEWADAPSAYIALEHPLTAHPGQDAALIWSADQGWSVAVESGCGEDLLITASLGGDVLTEPAAVVSFARAVLAGRCSAPPAGLRAMSESALARRLAGLPEPSRPSAGHATVTGSAQGR
ncbi:DUF6292 family protein [Lentzea sp. NBRC 102530]|uniref:DUF6292 family protein n=1 Tax=Lentzea sp. NBRC 102530 TaxID=3032201 RepID=UPI0024A317C1|nr:DUF6292 family protein [Lentzea sp. NBRC 102530]GLY46892.1 hypothetical protein Lesp01_05480 [Lentzea sp. NBRC 102530]